MAGISGGMCYQINRPSLPDSLPNIAARDNVDGNGPGGPHVGAVLFPVSHPEDDGPPAVLAGIHLLPPGRGLTTRAPCDTFRLSRSGVGITLTLPSPVHPLGLAVLLAASGSHCLPVTP
jgi:hypothetical protein